MKKFSKFLAFLIATVFVNEKSSASETSAALGLDARISTIREILKEDLKNNEATNSQIHFPSYTLNSDWVNWGNWGNWSNWNNWNDWLKWNDWNNWNNWNDFSNWQKFSKY